MKNRDLNTIIQETINLGDYLVFISFNEDGFSEYSRQVKNIVRMILQIDRDEVRIKTCGAILKTNVEDFKFGFLKLLFAPFFVTGKFWFARNTKKHIYQRYILAINSKLPVLMD